MRWLALASVVVALSVGRVEAAPAPAPAAVVLRLSDLQTGYSQDKALSLPVKHKGQIAGYETAFSHPTFTGLVDVDDVAWAYTNSTVAIAGYHRSLTGVLAVHPFSHTVWHRLAAPTLGNRRAAYVAVGRDKQGLTSYVVVVFQRNAMVGGVAVVWAGKLTDPAAIFRLVRLLDRRMRA